MVLLCVVSVVYKFLLYQAIDSDDFSLYGINGFILHLQGNRVAGICSFPDIKTLCLMCILVCVAPSWTHVLNLLFDILSCFSCYIINSLFRTTYVTSCTYNVNNRTPIFNSLNHLTVLYLSQNHTHILMLSSSLFTYIILP